MPVNKFFDKIKNRFKPGYVKDPSATPALEMQDNVERWHTDNPFGRTARGRNDEDVLKAYIPNFMYKPPFGYPRRDNVTAYKHLGRNPYVYSVIKTLVDEVTSIKWDIKVKDEFKTNNDPHTPMVNKIRNFLNYPNKNGESFSHIIRQVMTDILEIDAGVIVKVFNLKGELSQLFARDGASFYINPNIHGTIQDRDEYVPPMGLQGGSNNRNGEEHLRKTDATFVGYTGTDHVRLQQYGLAFKERAAYFQYGFAAASLPVPFGKREIVYFRQMPRSDDIYGTSPIGVLYNTILALIYGIDFHLDFFANNNIPDGIIQYLGANQDAIEHFRNNFEGRFTFNDQYGKRRKQFNRIPIVNGEIKFIPLSVSSKDMEIIAQQEWFIKIVWMCFGVNADEMGYTQDSNRSEGINQNIIFRRKAIRPLLELLKHHINQGIITEFFGGAPFSEVPVSFEFDNFDVDEHKQKLDIGMQEIQMGIKTPFMVANDFGIDLDVLKKARVQENMQEIPLTTVRGGMAGNVSGKSGGDNKGDFENAYASQNESYPHRKINEIDTTIYGSDK